MQKSLTTQLALTLFFGPLGLAYSSIAAAVFLTLVFAVLYFTELGLYAALLVWPIAILVGFIFVKLHNDGIRQSGSRLLLGPGEGGGLVSMLGSWGRALVILSLIGVAGYLVYWQSSNSGNKIGRIVDSVPVEKLAPEESPQGQLIGKSKPSSGIAIVEGIEPSTTIGEPVVNTEMERLPVGVEGSSLSPNTNSDSSAGTSQTEKLLFVDGGVVNLRDGPGTEFKILTQLDRDTELRENSREDEWVNVTDTNSNTTGWIFESLVRE